MSDSFEELRARFDGASYHRDVGMAVEHLGEGSVGVRVPFRKENSNPGDALHGGVYASVIGAAAELAAWSVIEPAPGFETGTLDLDVRYLAAAIGCDIVAGARVLRRGKELVHVEVDVTTSGVAGVEAKPVAKGLVLYRVFDPSSAPGAADRRVSMTARPDDIADGDVIEHGEMLVSTEFMARRGMRVRRMSEGRATLEMAGAEHNTDHDGRTHEGALAALIDSTGAMACWSVTGLDLTYKASTAGLYVSYHEPLRGEPALAGARLLRRNNEMFASEVIVCGADTGTVAATGSVTYRIVV